MRRLEHRVYAGVPRETVTVDTEVEGGGHVTVLVDGVETDADTSFRLKADSGDETSMSIGLVGATGESCVVTISSVDGGTDPDLLLCQTSDPAPVHLYRFVVTPETAMAAMERAAPRATFTVARTTRPTAAKTVKVAKAAKAAKKAKKAKAAKAAKQTRARKPPRRTR